MRRSSFHPRSANLSVGGLLSVLLCVVAAVVVAAFIAAAIAVTGAVMVVWCALGWLQVGFERMVRSVRGPAS